MCTAAIIAGGRARRLGGRPKGTLAFGPTSIVERQIATLRTLTDALLIVANDPAPYADLGVPTVGDDVPGAGAIGGVLTALTHASTDPVVVVACDMPFVSAAFLRYLIDAARAVDVAIPSTPSGYEPLCACYARACAPHLRRQIEAGVLKLQDVLPHLRVREVGPPEIAPFNEDGLLFCNVNTPDDYSRALARLTPDRPPS